MAEVSTENGRDTRLLGYLEDRILPQAERKGISWIWQDSKQRQVSSEWTSAAGEGWDGEGTGGTAGQSQTTEAPEGGRQCYLWWPQLVERTAKFTLVPKLSSLSNIPVWICWLTSDNHNSTGLQKVENMIFNTFVHYFIFIFKLASFTQKWRLRRNVCPLPCFVVASVIVLASNGGLLA